jgi:hypothetical protein
MPENGMTCGWPQHHGVDVLPKHHLPAVLTIKEKNEIDFLVRPAYAFQGLEGKPANTIQLSRHQKPGIHDYSTSFVLLVQNIPE